MASELKNDTAIIADEARHQGIKFSLSKFDYDLYHESKDLAFPMIRVKCVNALSKNERWDIYHDTEVVFCIEGLKLSSEQKKFLRTVEGVNFIIAQCKAGADSLECIKDALNKR